MKSTFVQWFRRWLAPSILIWATCGASATTYVVNGGVIKFYASSESSGATAQFIQSTIGIYNGGAHPWCGYRAYIDVSDKSLLATALAASISGLPVNFIYDDYAVQKNIPGHLTNFGCKVISIWIP